MSKRKQFTIFNIFLIIYLFINCVTGLMDDSTSVVERLPREINNRPLCAAKKDYDFITEYKRLPEHRYVAEYKRFPEYRYSFGIGKRYYDDSKRNTPYSFGIGKRYQMENNYNNKFHFFDDYLSVGNNNDNYPIIQDKEENKRAVPSRTYDFGVGKRNIHIFSSIQQPLNFDDTDNNNNNNNNDNKHPDIIKSQIWEQD